MAVIPEPDPRERAILNRTGEGTLVFDFNRPGTPNTEMVCGNCDAPLVRGVPIHQLRGVVIRCNRCGSYNEPLAT